jgi:hypothetical protein
MRADGQTACQPAGQTMTKLIDGCRNFANASKNCTLSSFICSPVTPSLCCIQIFSSAPVHKDSEFMGFTQRERPGFVQNCWRNFGLICVGKIGGVIQFLN